jgi:ribose transport system permease protein
MTDVDTRDTVRLASARYPISKGSITVVASTLILFVICRIFAPSSTSQGAISGMLPFAAVLAIVGLGQMLVVQQGGIDLSAPGAMSLAIVIVSHHPDGDNSKLPAAVLIAVGYAIGAGLFNGFLVGWLGLNAIIATLGTNALLYGAVLGISGGTPRQTTSNLGAIAGNSTLGIPHAVLFALAALALVIVIVKRTVAGRRFEAVGANAATARVIGLRAGMHRSGAYLWAQLLYCLAGILLSGITTQPTAYEGDSYLLPSVAVVVLGGTSLLGGRGFPVATVVAALFLTQLDQFVLALGVSNAVQTLVQAAALAIGVAIYTVDWRAVRMRFTATSPSVTASA